MWHGQLCSIQCNSPFDLFSLPQILQIKSLVHGLTYHKLYHTENMSRIDTCWILLRYVQLCPQFYNICLNQDTTGHMQVLQSFLICFTCFELYVQFHSYIKGYLLKQDDLTNGLKADDLILYISRLWYQISLYLCVPVPSS